MSADGLTRYGRWLVRRGPFVRGMMYGLVIGVYVVVGMAKGWWLGITEWREDRDAMEALARSRCWTDAP